MDMDDNDEYDTDQVLSKFKRLKVRTKVRQKISIEFEDPKRPTKEDIVPALTPYQGRYRRWGMFCCPKCSTKWSSGNSWANKGQECRDCLIMVYPHIQRPLKRRTEEMAPNCHHSEALCEKCKSLGYSCRNMYDIVKTGKK